MDPLAPDLLAPRDRVQLGAGQRHQPKRRGVAISEAPGPKLTSDQDARSATALDLGNRADEPAATVDMPQDLAVGGDTSEL